jgi:hypothetical protein
MRQLSLAHFLFLHDMKKRNAKKKKEEKQEG